MTKVDFKKTFDSYQAKQGEYRVLEVPELKYLMVDGRGDPNSSADFTVAIQALYLLAYKLKFLSKQQLEKDYVVPPLEGLWWSEDMSSFTSARDKSKWEFTLMLMVPEWITDELIEKAQQQVLVKNIKDTKQVRFELYDEGLSVQTLHIGSFDTEGPVLEEMHTSFIPDNGYKMRGKHHEIYFSDFRKTKPEKLKTVLRQPISPK